MNIQMKLAERLKMERTALGGLAKIFDDAQRDPNLHWGVQSLMTTIAARIREISFYFSGQAENEDTRFTLNDTQKDAIAKISELSAEIEKTLPGFGSYNVTFRDLDDSIVRLNDLSGHAVGETIDTPDDLFARFSPQAPAAEKPVARPTPALRPQGRATAPDMDAVSDVLPENKSPAAGPVTVEEAVNDADIVSRLQKLVQGGASSTPPVIRTRSLPTGDAALEEIFIVPAPTLEKAPERPATNVELTTVVENAPAPAALNTGLTFAQAEALAATWPAEIAVSDTPLTSPTTESRVQTLLGDLKNTLSVAKIADRDPVALMDDMREILLQTAHAAKPLMDVLNYSDAERDVLADKLDDLGDHTHRDHTSTLNKLKEFAKAADPLATELASIHAGGLAYIADRDEGSEDVIAIKGQLDIIQGALALYKDIAIAQKQLDSRVTLEAPLDTDQQRMQIAHMLRGMAVELSATLDHQNLPSAEATRKIAQGLSEREVTPVFTAYKFVNTLQGDDRLTVMTDTLRAATDSDRRFESFDPQTQNKIKLDDIRINNLNDAAEVVAFLKERGSHLTLKHMHILGMQIARAPEDFKLATPVERPVAEADINFLNELTTRQKEPRVHQESENPELRAFARSILDLNIQANKVLEVLKPHPAGNTADLNKVKARMDGAFGALKPLYDVYAPNAVQRASMTKAIDDAFAPVLAEARHTRTLFQSGKHPSLGTGHTPHSGDTMEQIQALEDAMENVTQKRKAYFFSIIRQEEAAIEKEIREARTRELMSSLANELADAPALLAANAENLAKEKARLAAIAAEKKANEERAARMRAEAEALRQQIAANAKTIQSEDADIARIDAVTAEVLDTTASLASKTAEASPAPDADITRFKDLAMPALNILKEHGVSTMRRHEIEKAVDDIKDAQSIDWDQINAFEQEAAEIRERASDEDKLALYDLENKIGDLRAKFAPVQSDPEQAGTAQPDGYDSGELDVLLDGHEERRPPAPAEQAGHLDIPAFLRRTPVAHTNQQRDPLEALRDIIDENKRRGAPVFADTRSIAADDFEARQMNLGAPQPRDRIGRQPDPALYDETVYPDYEPQEPPQVGQPLFGRSKTPVALIVAGRCALTSWNVIAGTVTALVKTSPTIVVCGGVPFVARWGIRSATAAVIGLSSVPLAPAIAIGVIGFGLSVFAGYHAGAFFGRTGDLIRKNSGQGVFKSLIGSLAQASREWADNSLAEKRGVAVRNLIPLLTDAYAETRRQDHASRAGLMGRVWKGATRPLRMFGEASRMNNTILRMGLGALGGALGGGLSGIAAFTAFDLPATVKPSAADIPAAEAAKTSDSLLGTSPAPRAADAPAIVPPKSAAVVAPGTLPDVATQPPTSTGTAESFMQAPAKPGAAPIGTVKPGASVFPPLPRTVPDASLAPEIPHRLPEPTAQDLANKARVDIQGKPGAVQPAPAVTPAAPAQSAPGSFDNRYQLKSDASTVAPRPAPVQAAPVQAAPVQAAPVQAAPVQPAPVKAAPVQTAPAATTAPEQTAPRVRPARVRTGLTNTTGHKPFPVSPDVTISPAQKMADALNADGTKNAWVETGGPNKGRVMYTHRFGGPSGADYSMHTQPLPGERGPLDAITDAVSGTTGKIKGLFGGLMNGSADVSGSRAVEPEMISGRVPPRPRMP